MITPGFAASHSPMGIYVLNPLKLLYHIARVLSHTYKEDAFC